MEPSNTLNRISRHAAMADANPPLRPQAGFTLMELLIALTLLALLLTLLFSGMRLANRSWDAADARNEQAVEMRMVWRFIDQQIGQAAPLTRPTPEGSELLFSGRSDGFEFVSPMPEHLGVGGYYIQRVEALGSRSGSRLVFTRWLYNPQVLEGEGGVPPWEPMRDGGTSGGLPEVAGELRSFFTQSDLIDHLDRMDVEYFGAVEADSDPQWTQKWDSELMPQLVRILLRTGGRDWPAMVFRVGA